MPTRHIQIATHWTAEEACVLLQFLADLSDSIQCNYATELVQLARHTTPETQTDSIKLKDDPIPF